MAKNSHHVVTNPNGGWSVKTEGSSRSIRNFSTQKDAIEYGRDLSRNSSSELVIHRKDGTIQSKDSHAADPHPPKG